MTNHSDIELVVMRRVRLIRILGLLISTATLAVLTSMAALWGVGREVWVARVLENMPRTTSLFDLANFWLTAFVHTRFSVQVLTVLTLISLIFLAREIARLIAHPFSTTPARA